MKSVLIIPDGCADLPVALLGGFTPMFCARTPVLDDLVSEGIIGKSLYVPHGMAPGSDVATLGLLGYYPKKYYTGRAPIEAAAQKILLGENDWAIRCNLVTIDGAKNGNQDGGKDDNLLMKSFTAGHISSEEAALLIETLNDKIAPLSPVQIKFHSGVSYRNLCIASNCNTCFAKTTTTYPPHDYTDKPIAQALPSGKGSRLLRKLMNESQKVFAEHPVNIKRKNSNKLPATQIWLWGLGQKPKLPNFGEQFNRPDMRCAMITAVDLLRGIAALIGWDNIIVPNITGYVDTDFAAKGSYAVKAIEKYDLVCVHIEATDEAGHEGNAEKKVYALEQIDEHIVKPIYNALKNCGDDWRIMVTPDHPTPIVHKTHTSEFVPWVLAGSDIKKSGVKDGYNETSAEKNAIYTFKEGWKMIKLLVQ
ncbi:MAG: cofactor-independent phosphoglycerate mutase [Planctomycetaceae bacterium]|jgi:2,3-bisphosphoglycerate-independent phosphoglycerate mutase|nr:cofactor-independent phosphoglycerate mutase [Planctomycetaceae bacterium]